MQIALGLAVLLIIVLGLSNPRLWKDMKSGHSSMDGVLEQGKEDLKIALRSKKAKKQSPKDHDEDV